MTQEKRQRKPKNHNYVCIRLYRNKAPFKNSCAAYQITELRICSVLSCIFYRSQNKQHRHFMAFFFAFTHCSSFTASYFFLFLCHSLPYLPAARLCYLLFTLSEKNRSSPLTVWHLRTFVALDFLLCPEPNYFLLCLKDTPNSAAFMTPAPLSRPGQGGLTNKSYGCVYQFVTRALGSFGPLFRTPLKPSNFQLMQRSTFRFRLCLYQLYRFNNA